MDVLNIWKGINPSTIFILPWFQDLLAYNSNKTFTTYCKEMGLVNTFLRDDIKDNEYNSPCLYLVFDFNSLLFEGVNLKGEVDNVNSGFQNYKHCIDSYDIMDYTVYVFEIPKKFEEELEFFFNCEYSKLNTLLPFYQYSEFTKKNKDSLFEIAEKVITKDPLMREWVEIVTGEEEPEEYWPAINSERETLSKQLLINTRTLEERSRILQKLM